MINLLPNHVRADRQYGRRNRLLLGSAVALLVTAALVVGIMLVSLQFVGADESALRSDIEANNLEVVKLESEISDLGALVARLQSVDDLYETSVSFSELIPEIGSLLPEGTVLNGLSLTGGNTDPLSLDVDMRTPELSAVLIRNLTESELFEAADLSGITPKGGDDPAGYNYSASLSVSFAGSAEAKKKEQSKAAAKKAALEEEAESQDGGQ